MPVTRSLKISWIVIVLAIPGFSQVPGFDFPNSSRPIPDAHNCYPYEGQWANRIDRALASGFPVAIEQDLAWYPAPVPGGGKIVVSHKAETTGEEPTLRDHFFEKVRPLIERELKSGDPARWPLIVLHFDFKDNQPALLHAVWKLLGEYEPWLATATKTGNPADLTALKMKPILVLTEDNDAQEQVFFKDVPKGGMLRLFGSAHTTGLNTKNRDERSHLAATLPPQKLLSEKPTTYRRWWNNSWFEVEEGGAPHAGDWTTADAARLKALVDHAHRLGFWIRFYTLDGFTEGESQGWDKSYNFGSRPAAEIRWRAALEAGVNLIASDQYEALSAVLGKR